MHRFKKILVDVNSDDSETAIRRAIEVADDSGARVTLIDVVRPLSRASRVLTKAATRDEMRDQMISQRRTRLESMTESYQGRDVAIDCVVRFGDHAQEITKEVLASGYDLVIKTAEFANRKTGRLFGSAGRSLMRICPVPVWMLKPELHGEFDQVLAAIDIHADDEPHQELNNEILELAHSIAKRDNAQLHVIAAWQMWMEHSLRSRAGDAEVDAAIAEQANSAQTELRRLVESRLVCEPGEPATEVHLHLRKGPASASIFSVAEQVEADLIVMGTVCRTGVAGFLIGNTAETILSDVTCSVLAIKPPGFQSPVTAQSSSPSHRFMGQPAS